MYTYIVALIVRVQAKIPSANPIPILVRKSSLHAQATASHSYFNKENQFHNLRILWKPSLIVSNLDFLVGSKLIAKPFQNEPHIYVIISHH